MENIIPNVGEEKRDYAEEKTSSPEFFVNSFLNSDLFLNGRHDDTSGAHDLRGYNDFKKELKKRRVDDTTDDEILRVFLGMNEVKLLLLHFAQYKLMFKYSEDAFCKDNNNVCREFGKYKALIEHDNSPRTKLDLEGLPVDMRIDQIKEMDAERQFRHTQTLNALFEGGYVPSKMIGRAMARIMLISEGMDTFERVLSDETNRFRMLAGENRKMK